ncbi:MAG: hypothetical protein AAB449_00340 [Patescibacteria group bacterium]
MWSVGRTPNAFVSIALFSALIILFILADTYVPRYFLYTPNAQASCTGGTGEGSSLSGIYGWAWSDTVGWICFGTSYCPAGGVSFDETANLNGYGWSDVIGWIQFGGLDTASMPSGPGTQKKNAQINGNNVQGWVKALSATGNGWDGWIALNGSTPGYGPTLTGGQGIVGPLTGYAWGSDVIGWIDFSQVSAVAQNPIGVAFDPSFNAAPTRVRRGESTYLSWSATCMSSCSVRDQSGALVPGSSVVEAINLQTPAITDQMTYILTCLDPNGAPSNDVLHVGIVPSVEEI